MISKGLRNFGGMGVEPPKRPPQYATAYIHLIGL